MEYYIESYSECYIDSYTEGYIESYTECYIESYTKCYIENLKLNMEDPLVCKFVEKAKAISIYFHCQTKLILIQYFSFSNLTFSKYSG